MFDIESAEVMGQSGLSALDLSGGPALQLFHDSRPWRMPVPPNGCPTDKSPPSVLIGILPPISV